MQPTSHYHTTSNLDRLRVRVELRKVRDGIFQFLSNHRKEEEEEEVNVVHQAWTDKSKSSSSRDQGRVDEEDLESVDGGDGKKVDLRMTTEDLMATLRKSRQMARGTLRNRRRKSRGSSNGYEEEEEEDTTKVEDRDVL